MMSFVEIGRIDFLAALAALYLPHWFIHCVNRDNTKFRDEIAYVGGPSFRRRTWPFGERRSCAPSTPATLNATESETCKSFNNKTKTKNKQIKKFQKPKYNLYNSYNYFHAYQRIPGITKL